jgi:hypothetical protein
MTVRELVTLLRWGWKHDRGAALIPLLMLAIPLIFALLLEALQ